MSPKRYEISLAQSGFDWDGAGRGHWWLPKRPRRRALRLARTIAVVVVVAAGAFFVYNFDHHRGGDPGNRGLDRLEMVRSAVPPDATSITMRMYPVTWLGHCASEPNSAHGWGEALVYVDFTDHDPRTQVVATIRTGLDRLGWKWDPAIAGEGGKVPHWTLAMTTGARASAFSYAVPARSASWSISASWQPPGPKAGGCP